jgi:hypothetical protein
MKLHFKWAIDGDLFHAHSLYLGHTGQDLSNLRRPEMEVRFQSFHLLFLVVCMI